jgi:diacylglycerol kinase family enzyme
LKALVLVNQKAGTLLGKDPERVRSEIRDLLSAGRIAADMRFLPAGDLTGFMRSALKGKPDVVVAGGGDGTISSIVSSISNVSVPLGVLPIGTLNHFARDLEIPSDLPSAVELIAGGEIRSVDLGSVNGRYFVNNSSIGLYPKIVHERDRQRESLDQSKWRALIGASFRTIRNYPYYRVRLSVDGRQILWRHTPFVFIGNNRYEMRLFSIRRLCLNSGMLHLYTANKRGDGMLLGLAVRTLFNRLNQTRDFDARLAKTVLLSTSRRYLRVGIDGEITFLQTPLTYKSHPGALRVIAPFHSSCEAGPEA